MTLTNGSPLVLGKISGKSRKDPRKFTDGESHTGGVHAHKTPNFILGFQDMLRRRLKNNRLHHEFPVLALGPVK